MISSNLYGLPSGKHTNNYGNHHVLWENQLFQWAIFHSYVSLPDGIFQAPIVGGIPTPLKNMKVNGKDDIPYMKWKNKSHVPNHLSVGIYQMISNY